jgi:hypothetical protein
VNYSAIPMRQVHLDVIIHSPSSHSLSETLLD